MSNKRAAVCIIIENLPVPIDRRVWQEARALRDAGYHVSIICPKGSGFPKSRETMEGIDIYRHWLWEASGPLGYLLEYSWALTAQFFLSLRVYARTRFRVLQACNPPDTIFLIALFFKLFGVRFIFDHHDLNPELYETKFQRHDLGYKLVCWAERLTFQTADVSIATNESYQQVAMVRGGMSRERTFVVRSCPDLGRIRIRPPQPELKEGRRHLVVYLGVMAHQDGLDLLLESIAFLTKLRKCDDALFVLIGSGPELPQLKALAKEKGLDAQVKFTGRLPDEDVAAYFSTAAFGVAPDRATPMNDKSTMNKILEYMAFGLPVVLYDLTEGRRSGGDAALYARNDDTEDFAQKIMTLLDSESLRAELGTRARKRIEEKLNWEMEKRELLQAYATALGE
ncbi:MAG TPA: glycosyltransferase family 4 protein [Terriglobia bacterium]|nr:glycosyltransferase family 4 protein [Terriglobia bacterium]